MQISKLKEPINEIAICIDSDTNDALCDKLLKIVADKYSRQILESVKAQPKSANMILSEVHIPLSTIYRRLQNLLDASLLHISGEISEDGKKFFLYQSKVREIHATFNVKSVEIKLVMMSSDNESKM